LSTSVKLPIITYHSIDNLGTRISTPIKWFERQMAWLAEHGWRSIRLGEAAQVLRENGSFPSKSVVLTFDDGMLSVRDTADAILQNYGLNGTIFIVTNQVGRKPEWYRLPVEYQGTPLLGIDDLARLSAGGWEIQPHTHDHPVLPHLSLSQQIEQIEVSRAHVMEWFGGEGDVLAYPFGQFNDQTVEAMKSCGMSGGVSLRFSASIDIQNPFDWPRLGSAWFKDSMLRLRLSVGGHFERYVRLKQRIKGDRSRHFIQPTDETRRYLPVGESED